MSIKVLLPNGVEIWAVKSAPGPIEQVSLYSSYKWYVKCPASKVRSTESVITDFISKSTTDEKSTEFEIDNDTTLKSLEEHRNEANSIYGHFWIQSKAKISNFFGFFNLTLSFLYLFVFQPSEWYAV